MPYTNHIKSLRPGKNYNILIISIEAKDSDIFSYNLRKPHIPTHVSESIQKRWEQSKDSIIAIPYSPPVRTESGFTYQR